MSNIPRKPVLLHVEHAANHGRRARGSKGGSAKRKTRPYTEAELDQFAEELRDESRAEQRETDGSYFGVASLFKGSHR